MILKRVIFSSDLHYKLFSLQKDNNAYKIVLSSRTESVKGK